MRYAWNAHWVHWICDTRMRDRGVLYRAYEDAEEFDELALGICAEERQLYRADDDAEEFRRNSP